MAAMINDRIQEVIFIGLPGPTHHYAGLSADNVAAMRNRGSLSNPRQAALQVLDLARLLRNLGVAVAFLPPQPRPHMNLLREKFTGSDAHMIAQAAAEDPALLEKACSAASMWTANAATVTPLCDASDGKLHITAANLYTNIHRRIEAADTYKALAAIFADVPNCEIYAPLPDSEGCRDEGAANHMRLAPSHSAPGLDIFIYGTENVPPDPPSARQTIAASRALAAQHHVRHFLFLRQNPDAIRRGVFHNDVIAVSNEHVLLVHEQAYAGGRHDIAHIASAYAQLHPGRALTPIVIGENELSVSEAVDSYFFNSQIVTKPNGSMAIIAPGEVQALFDGKGARLMENIRADDANPISEIHYADLRQSMRNGGGPACLRLRVPMTQAQLAAMRGHVNVMADDELLEGIEKIIADHYPAELSPQQLADPLLYASSRAVLAELGKIMRLPLL